MYTVTRRIEFCYGHRLLNYDGKCRFLHGHNGVAVVTSAAEALDERGMVVDFADIKRDVSQWIDENLDHRMILNRRDPVVTRLQELGEPLYLLDVNPTAENIARLIFDYAVSQGFPVKSVTLWETPQCFATYEDQ
jgi:6-pyruvoyltetrahydropterin/6-carboxytetrahydropterin synthase